MSKGKKRKILKAQIETMHKRWERKLGVKWNESIKDYEKIENKTTNKRSV
jgi:hypothetical protein